MAACAPVSMCCVCSRSAPRACSSAALGAYALAGAGEAGVADVIRILEAELRVCHVAHRLHGRLAHSARRTCRRLTRGLFRGLRRQTAPGSHATLLTLSSNSLRMTHATTSVAPIMCAWRKWVVKKKSVHRLIPGSARRFLRFVVTLSPGGARKFFLRAPPCASWPPRCGGHPFLGGTSAVTLVSRRADRWMPGPRPGHDEEVGLFR